MNTFGHAVRQLVRHPSFTLLVVAVLSLGFGAALAVGEIADSVLLRALPFQDPDRLVNAWQADTQGGGARLTVTGADFLSWKTETESFERMAAVSARGFNLAGGDQPERIEGAIVSADFFTVLGVAPVAGRVLSTAFGPRAAVLSDALWRSRFGGEGGVIGRTVSLDGEPVTVVGVMPASFRYPTAADIWVFARTSVPEHPTYPIVPETDRSRHYLTVIARLRAGASAATAEADLKLVQARLGRDHPDEENGIGAQVIPLREQLYGNVRPLLLVLLAVAALLLCVAWANAAHLFLARAIARGHEIAVRIALGATRTVLWRLFLAESFLVSAASAGIGLALSAQAAPLLVAKSPQAAALPVPVLSPTVLLMAAALAAISALCLGLLALLQPIKPAQSLQEGGRTGTGGRRQSQVRRFLLVFEVALTLVLLIGAGLLVRSFRLVSAVDPGIRADGVLAADLPLARGRYPDGAAQARFASELLRRLRADPQIDSAGLVSRLPFSPNNTVGDLTIPGREAEAFPLDLRLASDGYFDALGIPLREGRTFTSADLMPSTPPYVVINESAARRAFPHESPLGRRVFVWGEKTPSEIVGVVGDVRHTGLDTVPRPEAWRPLGAVGWPNLALVVRGKVPAASLVAPVREAVWGLDRELPIVHLQPMEERLQSSLGLRKFALGLLSTMALVALLLATAGIYGVTSYMVAQRTRELGVRLALGATPQRLTALLMGEMVPVLALGSIIGLAAGASLSRLLRGFLFGVAPVDAGTYAVLTLLLGVATCAATAAAAVRASGVDPAEALRAT